MSGFGARAQVAANRPYREDQAADDLVQGPAEQGGWQLEPGLVDLLLRDVGEEPGVLPLLSHALLETWRRRRGRRLTLASYAAAGGVQGAIAQTAETVFAQQLRRDQQPIARRLFLQLTELGADTAEVAHER